LSILRWYSDSAQVRAYEPPDLRRLRVGQADPAKAGGVRQLVADQRALQAVPAAQVGPPLRKLAVGPGHSQRLGGQVVVQVRGHLQPRWNRRTDLLQAYLR